MALADPQVLPTDPTTDLDRVSTVLGKFASADTNYELSVDHSNGSRVRHVVKLKNRKISADPLLPTQNRVYEQSVHVVIDHPTQGFSSAEVTALAELFVNFLDDLDLLAAVVQGQA